MFFLGQPSLLCQDRFRNADLADIVQKPCLANHFNMLLVQADRRCKL